MPIPTWNDRPNYQIKTVPRQMPERVKPPIVRFPAGMRQSNPTMER